MTPTSPERREAAPAAGAAGLRPRSILFLSLMSGAPWGGSEELWFRAALRAARLGHRVGCVAYGWPEKGARMDELRSAGCEVVELPNHGKRKRTLGERLGFELVTRLRQQLRARSLPLEDYDVAVINQGGYTEVCHSPWKGLRLRFGSYALTFHTYVASVSLSPGDALALRRWTRGAAANLFASERMRAVLEEGLGEVIPNAGVLVNPIAFDPPPAPTPLPPAPPVRMVMLAELNVDWKAQDQLVEALAGETWRSRDFVVQLFGEGRDRERLARLVEARGLSGRVRLEGHTRDPRAALGAAHLVLQITRKDALPLAVVEAMAMGRPLVVSRVGDMPSWVREGENGWVAEDASTPNAALALERAWRARAAWARMGERSFEIFRARFPRSPEDRFLEQVLGDGRTARGER